MLHVHKDCTWKMARGDGSQYHFLMVGGVYLPYNEPVFPEQHYITRGDGFIPRRILPFIVRNWQEEPNPTDRLLPALEQGTRNANLYQAAGPVLFLNDLDQTSASYYRIMKQRVLIWIRQTQRALVSKTLTCWNAVLRTKRIITGKLRSLLHCLTRY